MVKNGPKMVHSWARQRKSRQTCLKMAEIRIAKGNVNPNVPEAVRGVVHNSDYGGQVRHLALTGGMVPKQGPTAFGGGVWGDRQGNVGPHPFLHPAADQGVLLRIHAIGAIRAADGGALSEV